MIQHLVIVQNFKMLIFQMQHGILVKVHLLIVIAYNQ